MSDTSPTDASTRRPSSESSSNGSNNRVNTTKKRRNLPQWCFVPPKEGQSTMKKNVLLFGKTVDVFWCPHHERWDTHRLRDCPTEVQLQSYKYQLEVFVVNRQELEDARQKLTEMQDKVKSQRAHIDALEQKLRDANVPHEPSPAAITTTTDEDPLEYQVESLKQQLQQALDELETTRKELVESKSKVDRQRERLGAIERKRREGSQDMDSAGQAKPEPESQQAAYVSQTESRYKETKRLLKEEQERSGKLRRKLEEQQAANRALRNGLQEQTQSKPTVNGSSAAHTNNEETESQVQEEQLRRREAEKSIYRLSESLAAVTGALESERGQRNKLEQDFAEERKDFQTKIQELAAELGRSKMLLASKKQVSNGSVRSRNSNDYVKVCRLLVYSHHIVDDEKVKFIKSTASNCCIGGFIMGGSPGLIVVEGIEEDCDKFLEILVRQYRRIRQSPRSGKVESSTFAAAGKVISQADTIEDGRVFPKDLTQLDNEAGFAELKALCASTGMLDLIDEVCNTR